MYAETMPPERRAFGSVTYKRLFLLGVLQRGPVHAYQLCRIVAARPDVAQKLKKADIYYLMDRMAKDGFVTVSSESGDRGRQRLVFSVTAAGRTEFLLLVAEAFMQMEPAGEDVEVAIDFLPLLSKADALMLLDNRRQAMKARGEAIAYTIAGPDSAISDLAADHLLSLVRAELAWVERAVAVIEREEHWSHEPPATRASA